MQDAAFIEAAEPRPHRVLGLELLPFSIGHFILLQKHESVFVSQSGGTIGIEDLLLAVLICSQSYEDAKKSLTSRWLKWFVKYWGWRSRKLNIFEEAKGLKEYMAELEKTPDVVRSESKGDGGGMPWICTLRVFLMADLHMTNAEIMDYPLVLAQWDFYAFQALRGNDQTVSPVLEEAFKLAREDLN